MNGRNKFSIRVERAGGSMTDPRIIDNDAGEITATVNGQEVRGWSYKDDDERRLKIRMAHEFAEGWFQAVSRGKTSTEGDE